MTKEELEKWSENKLKYQNPIIEYLDAFIDKNFPEFLQLFLQLSLKLLLLVGLFLVIDFIAKKIILPFITVIINRTHFSWDNILYEKRVFNTLVHIFPTLTLCSLFFPFIFYNHPLSFEWIERLIGLAFLGFFVQLIFRVIDALGDISADSNNYKSVAIRSFGQLTKIMTAIVASFVMLFIMFQVSFSQILTVIGAITAFILLIFRDTILGFVAGVQVSTSKMVKVGDWVSIPKYNLEGTVEQINLITTLIMNFDKTISSIPTYDLIASEVRNFEYMKSDKTRRIKRSVYFNIKSFHFANKEFLKKILEINILRPVLSQKMDEIEHYNATQNNESKLKRELTNIGIFRMYVTEYLKAHPHIKKEEMIMVRQMEITPSGMPLEIYCFTDTAEWEDFERIQSDIFDHILTMSKKFDLEVVQTISVS